MERKFILAAAFASAAVVSAAWAKPRIEFREEERGFEDVAGALVRPGLSSEDNAGDEPPARTRGVRRVRKETMFGERIPDDALLFRASLPRRLRSAYDEVFGAVSEWRPSAEISTRVLRSEIGSVVRAVCGDNPELFWWVGDAVSWSNSDGAVTRLDLKYLFSADEAQSACDEFRENSEPVAFYASLLKDDMDKVKYVHDYLCLATDYDVESFRSGNYGGRLQSAWSAVVGYRTVCAGYARAFQLYMQQLGIPCAVVESDTHAWNVVSLGGRCYQMDVTWDDNKLYPQYFNLGRAEMEAAAEHSPDAPSRSVIGGIEEGDGSLGYERWFGGIPLGQPYTYAELSHMEEDMKSPGRAKIHTRRASPVPFALGSEDAAREVARAAEAAAEAGLSRFAVPLVARSAAAADSIDRWLSSGGGLSSAIGRSFGGRGVRWSRSRSSGTANISYRISLEVEE